jgi:predicted nuclease of predicted toxin-antitoxin system
VSPILSAFTFVIWIRRGNCSTSWIEAALRSARERIEAFVAHAEESFLAVE